MQSQNTAPPDCDKIPSNARREGRSGRHRFIWTCLLIYVVFGILPVIANFMMIAGQRPNYWGRKLPAGAAFVAGASAYLGPFCTLYFNAHINPDGDILKGGIRYGVFLFAALVVGSLLAWLAIKRWKCPPPRILYLILYVCFISWCIVWFFFGLAIAASHVE